MRLIAIVVALVMAREAHAMCGPSWPRFAPAEGVVPANPTVYLFVPGHAEAGEVVANVPFADEVIARSDAYVVHRIRVEARVGEVQLSVPFRFEEHSRALHATFTIGDAPAHHARVLEARRVVHDCCPAVDVIRLKLAGSAIAYRFAWDAGEPLVVPAERVEVGHQKCLGNNVDLERLATPQGFTLVALFADGSETPVGRSSMQLSDHAVRLPTELAGKAEARYAVLRSGEPLPGWPFALVLLACALTACAAVARSGTA